TSSITPTYPLLVDSALHGTGDTLPNVVISGAALNNAQSVSWTNAVGVSVNGNSLTKTATTGWGNAGATSAQSITTGDGYAELTVPDTTTHRFVGLSHGNSNADYTDVDFAIHPVIGGTIFIYEGGVSRGTFGSYTAGDKLRVAVEGGVVKYRKNGTLLYTSSITPTYPLLVDSALHGTGDTLSNVVINSGAGGAKVQWLVPDHLGTPRIILDQTGAFANVKRHDYLPFGEELPADTGGRTPAMGYVIGDNVRQQFTQYERDNETGLDYAHARYYSSIGGRFTTIDPLMASGQPTAPATWNRYSYVMNNPLKYIDTSGLNAEDIVTAEAQRQQQQIRQQQQQQPPPPGGPVSAGPTKIDIGEPPPGLDDIIVTVTPGRSEFRANVDTGDTGDSRYFTGYHSMLTIDFTDANGQPLNGTGIESVTGQGCGPDPTITQRATSFQIQNGQSRDLVGVGLFSPAVVTDQTLIRNVMVTNATTACTQTTTQSMTVNFPQGTFKVAFDRQFRNVNNEGRLQRVRIGPNQEVLGNYTISVSKPTVTRLK
ncbi:MAG TPA: RHS repeat-associated core domain-containing protein, partial [Pyrinomonadaceae bacterium]|nr:RHS repeat-associated core domain-containing protein [Pyrinomonadaceae bacterium]